MAALPKIGAGSIEEEALLGLLAKTVLDRERKFVSQALEKVGGARTLEVIKKSGFNSPSTQKVHASVARVQSPSAIRTDRILSEFKGLRIHLRGRKGLEGIVRDEVNELAKEGGNFRVAEVDDGLVAIISVRPFSIADIYRLRCFATVGFVLGAVQDLGTGEAMEPVAALITSQLSRRLFRTFTEGSMRYRLDFVAQGHQRGAVRWIANRAYGLCPEILNDARSAPWTIAIQPAENGSVVELTPKLTPDPRLYFRRQDVPAATHPPLAACMARVAGKMGDEIVWDPFCGSGLELIERALLGGVRHVIGTDLDADAVAIAESNFASANLESVKASFTCCDFRDWARIDGFRAGSVSLVITNPPLGKRVPVPNLRKLIEDLFSAAATVLKPGGRLVFANPFNMKSPQRSLKLQSRQTVDFGGFDCWMEKYLKLP